MIAAVERTVVQGLTSAEVLARRARGQGNNVEIATTRSYKQILRENVLTFINMVLFAIGAVLVLLGLYTDALLSVGIVAMNVVIGVIQEARAKRQLDQIALLTRPRATVIRDGEEQEVDPSELVLGDVLVANPGDQIVLDGKAISASEVEVDESLLTGEADSIPKQVGDPVYSGSFCVAGRLIYEAEKVGAESYANQITTSARAFTVVKTPLQTNIDFVIRILVLLAAQMGILLAMAIFINQTPAVESARMAAVIAGLIPNGLFFMISIAYAMGAVRMAGRGALIQRSNAVESMSNVNVLCLDKTGTLTANRINFHAVHPLGVAKDDLKHILGVFAASVSVSNRTTDAIAAACPGTRRAPVDEVAFTSVLKWSALTFDDEAGRGVYVLGAPEVIAPNLRPGTDLGDQTDRWADEGLRVLLLAHRAATCSLRDAAGNPVLPDDLEALGLISFSDELRPEARETLERFAKTGIRLKIISGDNPHTVASLAKQAGFASDITAVSGVDLARMDEAQFGRVADQATVFGRITPQQKEMLVNALRSQGNYVAMIGDGVNDVLSLKKADIGIAMNSGSQATRGVADIVLINDSFAALPPAFLEGQRIVNGMQDIVRLFLVRVFYMALIIVGVAVIGLGFPFSPINSSLLTLLTVGVPVFFLAAWARPAQAKANLIRSVLRFIVPASFSLALVGLGVYIYFYVSVVNAQLGPVEIGSVQDLVQLEQSAGRPFAEVVAEVAHEASAVAQTALTTVLTLCGLVLIVFVEPPTRFWVAGDEYSGDWRPTLMALGLLAVFIVILAVPPARSFFELEPLNPVDFGLIAGVTAIWAIGLRYVWRAQIFDRFLNLEVHEQEPARL